MAKAIDSPITGLESDKSWERYKGSRVREYLQKKIGAFYRPDKRQDDNAYHLLGFETEETKADWLKRWQAAVDAGDSAAMSALWTDKLVIQNTSLGGNTDNPVVKYIYTGSNNTNNPKNVTLESLVKHNSNDVLNKTVDVLTTDDKPYVWFVSEIPLIFKQAGLDYDMYSTKIGNLYYYNTDALISGDNKYAVYENK